MAITDNFRVCLGKMHLIFAICCGSSCSSLVKGSVIQSRNRSSAFVAWRHMLWWAELNSEQPISWKMPQPGFRLLQSPNNFQGVKLGWWIIHKWENCPCCQVKHLYRVLLNPFSWWWLMSLCNVLYTPTRNLFYFIYFIAGSGIQLASQPFCQNFTGTSDITLHGLFFNRWPEKPPSLAQVG